jgi:hypothetical protein
MGTVSAGKKTQVWRWTEVMVTQHCDVLDVSEVTLEMLM